MKAHLSTIILFGGMLALTIYAITHPDVPKPQLEYVSCPSGSAFVRHSSGGIICEEE